ncbi:hypothetical protein SLEP1_g9823 [Rubroshorea leprosula]|uniref:Uncharacterized protein n=1 Tax=Rubroshorea leprosula TaxID=152421 RepID=A0AAV5IG17_9ROSI|nr:hypothetical protein SLEP1_g9823 [Rubroshorea leprosula]
MKNECRMNAQGIDRVRRGIGTSIACSPTYVEDAEKERKEEGELSLWPLEVGKATSRRAKAWQKLAWWWEQEADAKEGITRW